MDPAVLQILRRSKLTMRGTFAVAQGFAMVTRPPPALTHLPGLCRHYFEGPQCFGKWGFLCPRLKNQKFKKSENQKCRPL